MIHFADDPSHQKKKKKQQNDKFASHFHFKFSTFIHFPPSPSCHQISFCICLPAAFRQCWQEPSKENPSAPPPQVQPCLQISNELILCRITKLQPLLGRQKVTQNSSRFSYNIQQGVSHCQRWNLSSNHEKNYSPHCSGHASLKCEQCHVHIKHFWTLWIKSWCGERQLWSTRTPAGPEALSLLSCGWCCLSAHS